MDKKQSIIVGMIIVFVLILGIGFLIIKNRTTPLIGPVVKETETPKLATWEDPAGFSFAYPEEVEIDSHEEDTENYAHLELVASEHSGKILIWMKGTAYSEIEEWVKEEVGEKGQILDTELNGEPAKKIAYSEPEKLVVAAIDIDALILIELYPDEEGYWQEVFNQILDSFTYIPLEGEEAAAPETTGGGGGGIIYETEEVIE